MGCNIRLADSCVQLGLDKFILSVPLERGKWIPVQLKLCSIDHEEPALAPASPGMKVCADAIEALLGLVYLTSGYEASVEIAHELGISLPTDGSETTMVGNPKHVRPALLDVVKSTIGKDSFDSPQLVEEAFTHPSAVYQDVSSYQRLEWVGDAVLCLAMREWLYFAYPSMEVGDLVNMESALVSNETLAYLCVQNGLHTFINHRDQGLPSRLEHYEWCVKELGRGLWGTGELLDSFIYRCVSYSATNLLCS
jgi:dsRNA-specific ribonuclease